VSSGAEYNAQPANYRWIDFAEALGVSINCFALGRDAMVPSSSVFAGRSAP
jgi:hypothetical protein